MEMETWTSDEFGTSHRGWVGVLVSGAIPKPIFVMQSSNGGGEEVSHWYAYGRPRADTLRGVCSSPSIR